MSDPLPTPPPSDSAISRIFGVFFSPGKTFESIAARPTWLAPLLLWTALSLAVTFVLMPRMDFREAIRKGMERRGQTVSQEQVDSIAEKQAGISKTIGWGIGALSPTIVGLVVAVVFWGAHKAFGRDMSFGQAFGATTHAFLPAAFGSLLLIPVLIQRGTVSPEGVGELLKSNLGFLVDPASKAMHSLASSIDIFSFWSIALLSLGYSKAARNSFTQSLAIVGGLWLVWVIAKAGLAAAFS
ncbi:MAG TPA: YIP1 family protein [Thermoanaerobaculia bacterium]